MESKIIDEANKQVDDLEQMAKNFSNFVDNLSANMSDEHRDQLQKELKSVDLSDVSQTIKKVNEEIAEFRNKYNR